MVTAAVALLGVVYAEKLTPAGEHSPRTRRCAGALLLGSRCIRAGGLFFSLLLLVLRGILILLLWRHRLRPELARTQRMTRSLGVNLTIPQFAWPRLSLAGLAVHAGIVLTLGTLAYVFREWIVSALIEGSIGLFLIVIGIPAQLIAMVFNFFYAGTPFDLAEMWTTLPSSSSDVAKLLLLAGVLLVAERYGGSAGGSTCGTETRSSLKTSRRFCCCDRLPTTLPAFRRTCSFHGGPGGESASKKRSASS